MSNIEATGSAASSAVAEASELEISVLGTVRIQAGRAEVTGGHPLERALLVRLALADGYPVPDRRLAEDLWGDVDLNPPIQRMRVVVSRLRSALGVHGGSILRTPAGYRTTARIVDVPAAEAAAQRMHAARRDGHSEAAVEAAEEALRLWRGPALADLAAMPFARAEADRLEEWRLSILAARFEAALQLDSSADVLPHLTTTATQNPLHEPLSRAYALALYRCGRQTDALMALRRLRDGLAAEYGVDPSPETAQLELAILRHDPALQHRSGATAVAAHHDSLRALDDAFRLMTALAHTGPADADRLAAESDLSAAVVDRALGHLIQLGAVQIQGTRYTLGPTLFQPTPKPGLHTATADLRSALPRT
ncbi:BTAD domain-containing putative transcriptional regulator [Nocardia sp. NPDC088792]|uniref:AfsR/SARP family transcriptional regulator n=1 Tax=Nocardia sp. NPDC088792 TaxID=3364332 RepID=UPI0037FC13FA